MSALAVRPDFVPVSAVCRALGVSRAQAYPDRRVRVRATPTATQPRQLAPTEREHLLEVLHSERFIDQAPRQVHASLLSEGQVIASVSTMYRVLSAAGEVQERRPRRPPQRHAVPRLSASAPNQVWSWDITKLPTQVKGVLLNLYVILDLYSRMIVGWMVSTRENAGLARHMFKHALTRHGIKPDELIVHQDRGAPMIATSFRELLDDLGVEPSYSRPRVSNDNAFSESQFKTMKFAPDYPGRFADMDAARAWLNNYVPRYNNRPHEGLAMFTPTDVYQGKVETLWQVRQAALDAHYRAHPQRYPNGPPKAKRPPQIVQINPLDDTADSAANLLAKPGSFRPKSTPIEIEMPVIVT